MVQQFKSNTFIERYASTIGVDFTMKTVAIDDKKVKVDIGPNIYLAFFGLDDFA